MMLERSRPTPSTYIGGRSAMASAISGFCVVERRPAGLAALGGPYRTAVKSERRLAGFRPPYGWWRFFEDWSDRVREWPRQHGLRTASAPHGHKTAVRQHGRAVGGAGLESGS